MINALKCLVLIPFWLGALVSLLQGAESAELDDEGWIPLELDSDTLNTLLSDVTANGPNLMSLEFTPYRSQGRLEGCGYSYQVLLKDWAYRSNQPTTVFGSVVFFAYQDRAPFLSLRIGLTDIEEREGSLWQKNSPPHYAYLRYEEESTAGEEYSVVDGEEGARNFIYLDPEFEKMAWFLIGESITVAFNRVEGGSDLEFTIPIMFTEIWEDLGVCFRDLSQIEQ